jgi:hypothetical protein
MVYSGFRFVRMAHDAALPIAIVNRGRTRADDLAVVKVEDDVGLVLGDVIAGAATTSRGASEDLRQPRCERGPEG